MKSIKKQRRMNKEFNFEIKIDGGMVKTGFITIHDDGTYDTSDAEESFFKALRQQEKFLKQDAFEEFKEKLIAENEDRLQEIHAENYMGTDDDMPDEFDNWICDLDYGELKELLKIK
jgi:hypothetical protein